MDRSYTVVVTKTPPPSLIMLRLKSRSFSSGNMQSDSPVFPFPQTSYAGHVGVDYQLSDNGTFDVVLIGTVQLLVRWPRDAEPSVRTQKTLR